MHFVGNSERLGVNTISGSYSELYGAVFALPAVAEKGALDVRLELSASGGHSSIPPTHTVSHIH